MQGGKKKRGSTDIVQRRRRPNKKAVQNRKVIKIKRGEGGAGRGRGTHPGVRHCDWIIIQATEERANRGAPL